MVQLLNEQINPSIAAPRRDGFFDKGRRIDGLPGSLVGVVRGAGLAAMTLRQGIERAILDNIPEVTGSERYHRPLGRGESLLHLMGAEGWSA